jgi:dihydroorotate dehydrogenase (fumarate)
MTGDPDSLRRLEEAGAAAAVFPSLFEEQIEQEQLDLFWLHEFGTESFGEALTYLPELDDYNVGPDGYLRRLEVARRSVSIPLLGSLNGASPGGWVRYARLIQETGADALELNAYFVAADANMPAGAVEERYLDLVADVAAAISIPLAVKVAPFFSSFAHFARRLVEAGAKGLVLFNRFIHPDIDLETLRLVPNMQLSTSWESRLPLTWIALLRGRIGASLAATGGVHDVSDLLKLLLAGADVTMIASAVYRKGPEHVRTLVEGLRGWASERGYHSIEQMKGSMSQARCPDPTAFERVSYMKAQTSFGRKPGGDDPLFRP